MMNLLKNIVKKQYKNAYYSSQKIEFCKKYFVPSYCPKDITPAKWTNCMELLFLGGDDANLYCHYEKNFKERCFWSDSYNGYKTKYKNLSTSNVFDNYTKITDKQKSDYSRSGKTIVYDGYVFPYSTIKSSLPFTDFGKLFDK